MDLEKFENLFTDIIYIEYVNLRIYMIYMKYM